MRARDLWRRLAVHAARQPDAVAMDDLRGGRLAWGDLLPAVVEAAAVLRERGVTRVGLLADNGIDWALADLGALALGTTLVPLPAFFSEGQLRHVVARAGLDVVLTDDPARAEALWPGGGRRLGGLGRLQLLGACSPTTDLAGEPVPAPSRARITFTSGTTGTPKGVCLPEPALLEVAHSLVQATEAGPGLRHLCTLPLAILLEDVGGLQRTLLAGGTALLPRLADVGLAGSSDLDPGRLAHALTSSQATSAILMPAMLTGLVDVIGSGAAPAPRTLDFLGVGGAAVDADFQQHAEALGLPVYEGYGLSEAASVVSLNTRRSHRRGSVGRPLPHVTVAIADDGEIRVGGALFEGYLHDPAVGASPDGDRPRAPDADGLWSTGDLGHLDEDGFLHVHGRRDALLVTRFGRNLEPTWVEREACGLPGVRQAAVVALGGDPDVPGPRTGLTLVLVTADGAPPTADALARWNAALPDFARVTTWVVTAEAFTEANGLLDADGEPRRQTIRRRHLDRTTGRVGRARVTRPDPLHPDPAPGTPR